MKIAICDDNSLERELLLTLLQKYASSASIQCEFNLYSDGMALYYDVEDGEYYDLVFLDLFLGEYFGIDIAKKLRDIHFDGKIIFCTVSSDYAVEGYAVSAAGYMLKPYDISDVKRIMDRIIPDYHKEYYRVKQKSKIICIPIDKIIYIESNNTKCIIHRTQNKDYVVYKTLGEIENELSDKRFLRCHQSYLVNMNYIEEVNDVFVLTTGDEVLIRKREKKEMREAYLDYVRKYNDV